MGHCCEILTFDGATSKAEMQAEVNEWFYNNYDRLEGPCPSFAINWSRGNMVFDGEKAVKDYLNKTFGNYDQYAVQYHPEVKSEPSATYKRLVDRCNNEINKLSKAIFNAYHYLDGISSKYITCKGCGSKLNREVMVKSLSEWYTEKIITNDVRDKVRTAMNSDSKFDELSVQHLNLRRRRSSSLRRRSLRRGILAGSTIRRSSCGLWPLNAIAKQVVRSNVGGCLEPYGAPRILLLLILVRIP